MAVSTTGVPTGAPAPDVPTRKGRRSTHRWTRRELILWDNRCVLHRAAPYDAVTQGRVIRRCTVLGEVPV